jgi:tryptophan-rich sensory protein
MPTRRADIAGLLGALGLCYAVAGIGGYATSQSVKTWYAALERPPVTPPDWVFGPVWTLLYTLMAIAAWRVWRRQDPAPAPMRRLGLGLFAGQLALNLLWSFIFFAWQMIHAAAVEVVVLWLLIVATTWAFARVDRVAAWLMAPYIAWVAYASMLNIWIAILN